MRFSATLCYEVLFNGAPIIRSWAAPPDVDAASGDTVTTFWQEVLANPQLNTVAERCVSRLRSRADARPIAFEMARSNGPQLAATFHADHVALKLDAALRTIPKGGVETVLQSNMVPQIALLLRDGLGRGSDELAWRAFMPEIADVVEYRLTRGADGIWMSNFEERMTLDPAGLIDGVSLQIQEFSVRRASLPQPRWRVQAPVATAEAPTPGGEQVSVPRRSGQGHVAATVEVPLPGEGRCAAVFLAGSGTSQRDGRTDGIEIGYDRLLQGCARHGVASLRYDRASSADLTNLEAVGAIGLENLLDEAADCFEFLAIHPATAALPRLLVGHSFGGLLALRLAGRLQGLAGVALLSAPGRPLVEILRSQLRRQLTDMTVSAESRDAAIEQQERFFASVTSVDDWSEDTVDATLLAERRNLAIWRDILFLDPLELVPTLGCPLLIVQGGNDQQVGAEDAARLENAAQQAGIAVHAPQLADYDHLFRRVSRRLVEAGPVGHYYRDRRRQMPKAFIRDLGQALVTLAERGDLAAGS